jgi:hypothetical protein
MSKLTKGLILAGIQLAIVASLGAKLAIDRARLPRVWAKVRSYDPDLPIRGRYLALQLLVQMQPGGEGGAKMPRPESKVPCGSASGKLLAINGQLAATPAEYGRGVLLTTCLAPNSTEVWLMQPVLYFLPEHAENPMQKARGGELWAEVTVPKAGPPRPIRLAVKKGNSFTPLEIK